MPTNLPSFPIPEKYPNPVVLDALLQADDALVRLDERMRLSPVGSPCASRLLYRNACASMQNQHCLVHLEDLVLLDGHAFSGPMYPDLSAELGIFKYWQAAFAGDATSLLAAPMPGEAARMLSINVVGDGKGRMDRPDMFYDPSWDEAGRLDQWRQVWQSSINMPPLLAAATVWDAWHTLRPEQQGPWRGTLLAALVLRARSKTRHILLPLDSGERISRQMWRAHDNADKRMLTFFDIVSAAVKSSGSELVGLASAKERMSVRLRDVQKTSRLHDLMELMIAKPLVSIPLACKALGISKQAVRAMIPKLGSTPREISERQRYRCWTVP